MDDLIYRQDAVKTIKKMAWENDNKFGNARNILLDGAKELDSLPSVQPDNRLAKIADLVEGTIDHFDLDDAMDLLYQIKDVIGER